MIYKNGIEILQLDLISSCNAQCHFCFRQDARGQSQPHYPKNVHLEPAVLIQALKDPAFRNLKEILFCGNFGDALASPHLISILDGISEIHPSVGINIHSNGGLGSSRVWQALGERLQGKGRFVKFSIDGLEDTNHIYRKGVEWAKIMANAKTFMDAGGRAIWKFVVFDHNKHQIEDARALSEKMGFAKFVTSKNYFPEGESRLLADCKDLVIDEVSSFEVNPEERAQKRVHCQSYQPALAFLDFAGDLWPCCWIAGWKYSSEPAKRNFHANHFKNIEDKEFNSIYKHSVSEVLSHEWFHQSLSSSWNENSAFPVHYECLSTCGFQK